MSVSHNIVHYSHSVKGHNDFVYICLQTSIFKLYFLCIQDTIEIANLFAMQINS
jgi:hypothetical protein